MDGLASEIAVAPDWLLDMIFGKHPASEKARFDLPADIPEGQRNETLHPIRLLAPRHWRRA